MQEFRRHIEPHLTTGLGRERERVLPHCGTLFHHLPQPDAVPGSSEIGRAYQVVMRMQVTLLHGVTQSLSGKKQTERVGGFNADQMGLTGSSLHPVDHHSIAI